MLALNFRKMSGKSNRYFPGKPEYGYLIHLIRCGIHGDIPEELPAGMSFQKVYDYAMAHDVANLAFYGVEKLKRKPEQPLYDTWKYRRDLALARDMNQEFAGEEIVQAFRAQGILFKELQGTVLKKLYPRPEYRTMSDLDYIVEKSSLEKCGEILGQLGYDYKQLGDFEIDGTRRPDIFIEIHTDYFSEFSEYCGAMGDPFSGIESTESDGLTELYLYNVIHTAKHYYSGGCGIRRVLDMYYLDLWYGGKIDREYVDSVLQEQNLGAFSRKLSDLGRQWFGEPRQGHDDPSMVNYILDAGVHGKRKNYIANSMEHMQGSKGASFGIRIRYLFTRLFPDFRTMTVKFPILRECPVLYPFCWIYRILRMIFGRHRKESLRDLKLVLQTKDNGGLVPHEEEK